MGNGMNKYSSPKSETKGIKIKLVLPGLYLGNFRDAKDMEQLTKNNITHILSIHDNAQPVLEHLVYKCIHAADSPDQEISGHFQESIDFIHNCRVNNGACLVHCMAGISRSTAIVAAYIMAVTQLNWRDAIKAIKCSRSIANPNYGFQRQLQDFWNLQAEKERERLKKDFPNVDFKDEEYLKEVMAHSGEHDLSDEDSLPNALSRQRNRRKIYSVNKENETSEDDEITTTEMEVES